MYYFGYASSLDLSQMRRLCGWHCHVVGRAILKDYDFCLDSRGYANIKELKGSKVWGVLYEIDQKALDAMDEFEGYPKVFNRMEVFIQDEEDKKYKSWVYYEPGDIKEVKPNPTHWHRVLQGARDHKMPKEWMDKLVSYR